MELDPMTLGGALMKAPQLPLAFDEGPTLFYRACLHMMPHESCRKRSGARG